MTISTPDIVRVIEARLTDCRCFGALVDPKGFKPCGGCEYDKHCLDEIVRLRAERDEAIRERDEARLTEDLRRMDAITNLLYASIEKRKLRESETP